jgi:Domain of unknown function (DUF397)
MSGAEHPVWRKSTKCDSNACVEVAIIGDRVLLRDSSDPDGPTLTFTRDAWVEFLHWAGREQTD